MEINRVDVVKLILQFLQESGYLKSLEMLQNESEVSLNLLDNKQILKKDIEEGKWHQVLKQIRLFKISNDVLLDLYELIICELVEVNENQVAHKFYLDQILPNFKENKEKLLRLDYLIRKPGKLDINEIYLDNLTRQQRRFQIGERILVECIETSSSKLLELIGEGLKYRLANKMIQKGQKFNIFQNIEQQSNDEIVCSIDKVIKYGESMRVNSATYTPDGANLITGSVDGIIEVWDVEKQQINKDLEYQNNDQFMLHNNSIIDISTNNDIMSSLDTQGQIKIWKLRTGKCLKIIDSTHTKPISSILLGFDPSTVFSASDVIQLYGLKSGNIHKHFRGHQAQINQMIQSDEGSRLYSCAQDFTIRIWDVSSGEQALLFKCDTNPLKIVKIPSKQFLICQENCIIHVSQSFNEIKRIKNEINYSNCCASKQYAYGLSDNKVYVYDISTAKGLKMFKLPGQKVIELLHNPKKNQIFSYSSSGELVFIRD